MNALVHNPREGDRGGKGDGRPKRVRWGGDERGRERKSESEREGESEGESESESEDKSERERREKRAGP